MKIHNQINIEGKLDNCIVRGTGEGKIHVGSITLEPDEAADFCQALADAVKQINPVAKEVK